MFGYGLRCLHSRRHRGDEVCYVHAQVIKSPPLNYCLYVILALLFKAAFFIVDASDHPVQFIFFQRLLDFRTA